MRSDETGCGESHAGAISGGLPRFGWGAPPRARSIARAALSYLLSAKYVKRRSTRARQARRPRTRVASAYSQAGRRGVPSRALVLDRQEGKTNRMSTSPETIARAKNTTNVTRADWLAWRMAGARVT